MLVDHNKLITVEVLQYLREQFEKDNPTYHDIDQLFNLLQTDNSMCSLVSLSVNGDTIEEQSVGLTFDELVAQKYYYPTNFPISVQIVNGSPKLIGYCFSATEVELIDPNMNTFYDYLDSNNQFPTIIELNKSDNSRVDPIANNNSGSSSCGIMSWFCDTIMWFLGLIVSLIYVVTTYLLSWTFFVIGWITLIGIELYALSSAAIAITESVLITVALGALSTLILVFLVLVILYALSVVIIDAAKENKCEDMWSSFCGIAADVAPFAFKKDDNGEYIESAHEAAQAISDELDSDLIDEIESIIDKGVDKTLSVADKAMQIALKYAVPIGVAALIIYST